MKKELFIEYQQALEGGKIRDIRKLIEAPPENCPTNFYSVAQRGTTLHWLEKKKLFEYIEELEDQISDLTQQAAHLEAMSEPITDQDIFGGFE